MGYCFIWNLILLYLNNTFAIFSYVGMKSVNACNAAMEALNGWEDGLGNKIYVVFKDRNFMNKNGRFVCRLFSFFIFRI